MSAVRKAFAAFLLAAPLAALAGPGTVPGFQVTGRLAVGEPLSCDGGTYYPFDLTTVSQLTWTQCHAAKQHMTADGVPVTANAYDPAALRPLQVTVDLEAWCAYKDGGSDIAPRVSVRTQSGSGGAFKANIPAFTCGRPKDPTAVVLRASASLEYRITDSSGGSGTVRALWTRNAGLSVYASVLPPQPAVFNDGTNDWVVPKLMLAQNLLPPRPANQDLGHLYFFETSVPTYYDYVRGALGAWQTIVSLHNRLRGTLENDGHAHLYRRIFITEPAVGCTSCYTLYFSSNSAGYGFRGGIAMRAPDPALSQYDYSGLISIGFPAHEFGHSMHAGIATGSFGYADYAMNAQQNADGSLFPYHMALIYGDVLQQQDMRLAITEGFGNAMAAYFMSDCQRPARHWGDPEPTHAMWNPSNFAGCDIFGNGCPYGAFRFQMTQRGIAEGSPAWHARLDSLTAMANDMVAHAAVMVSSNNEGKFSDFVCDLLDANSDTSYAAFLIGGRAYLPDYGWHAAERLDGRNRPLPYRTYSQDPIPELVAIPLGSLLESLDTFIAPGTYPGAVNASGAIIDGANGAYNDARMSFRGPFAPHALGTHLLWRSLISRTDLNSILRANRMEELP